MIWKVILIPFFMLWTPSSIDHGIYITVIEINHDRDTHKGQVIIKSFSDDLVSALRAMNFNIPQDANPCEEKDFLSAYIEMHLKIKINGVALDLDITNCAIESDTHWVYFDFEQKEDFEKVEVEADWMTELFGNQQNIIKAKSGDQRLNDRLSAKKTISELEF